MQPLRMSPRGATASPMPLQPLMPAHTRYYNLNCNEATCAADLNKGADQSPIKDERVLSSEAIAFAKLFDPFYTSSLIPVAGKERSDMRANTLAAADSDHPVPECMFAYGLKDHYREGSGSQCR